MENLYRRYDERVDLAAIVVIALILFRHALGNIVARLLSIRFRDFEFAFGNQAGKVAENIGSANRTDRLPPPEDDRLTALAEKSPRAAILEAWLSVEVALRKLASSQSIDSESQQPLKMVQLLYDKKVIDWSMVQSLRGLAQLRNLAVHATEPELTTQKAVDFIVLANAVLFVLSSRE